MTSSYSNRADGANDDRGITRYWCQRDASVPLAEGYLALHTFGMRSPALRTIDELAELQAAKPLVTLGFSSDHEVYARWEPDGWN